MHILIMLLVMIVGLSLGENVSWLLGLPVMALSLWFFSFGSDAWREKQSNFFFAAGLCCAVLIVLFN